MNDQVTGGDVEALKAKDALFAEVRTRREAVAPEVLRGAYRDWQRYMDLPIAAKQEPANQQKLSDALADIGAFNKKVCDAF